MYVIILYIIAAGLIAKTFRTIFVQREEQDSKTNAVREIRRYANGRGKWPQVLIFPEGKKPSVSRGYCLCLAIHVCLLEYCYNNTFMVDDCVLN